MIVARQELPGKMRRKIPSRRDGMISVPQVFTVRINLYPSQRIVPCLRHGIRCYAISRQFLPGYFHWVPTGGFYCSQPLARLE